MTERDDNALQGWRASIPQDIALTRADWAVPTVTLESIQRDPAAPPLAVNVAGLVLRQEIDPVDALDVLKILVDAVGQHLDMLHAHERIAAWRLERDDWIRRSNSQSPVSCGTCGGLETDWMHGPYVSSDPSTRHPFNPS
jgi:hypothetical protein